MRKDIIDFTAKCFAVLYMFFFLNSIQAQERKCAFDETINKLQQSYPELIQTMEDVRDGDRYIPKSAAKTTIVDNPTIPVVFHIVLRSNQLAAIGGEQGAIDRVNAQMKVLNDDFNAMNADSIAIPNAFKSLFASTGFSFGLAQTAPDGTATNGYEIIVTDKVGFDIEGGWGSGFGFSGAKYTQGGGANAWDVNSYLNIWIVNPLDFGTVTDVLGLAIPAYLTGGTTGISPVERGIVLHYRTFGDGKQVSGNYLSGSDNGRTLTHEVGHYFELLHIWGDDDGKCPSRGGDDDGISDTPPQAYPSFGCEVYPKYDGCTNTGDGIMFMNYMDYSNDDCLLMFTKEQVARMRLSVRVGGDAYSLTQQEHLLIKPNSTSQVSTNEFVLYPNPANDIINIRFKKQAVGLQSIYIADIMGSVIVAKEYDIQSAFYSFSSSGMQAGMYFVVFNFDSGKEVHKVLVR